jgi:uncharacterized protein (TIGR03437 family)
MSRVHVLKIFLTMLVLLLAAGMLQAQNPPVSPLVAAPTSVTLSYQKGGAGSGGQVVVTLTIAAGSDTFVVDPSTVPYWLTVGAPSGPAVPAPGGATVTFDPSATVSPTLSAGGYNGFVHAKVSGFQDLVIPVTLVVSDPASTLTVADKNGPVNLVNGEVIHWTPGTAYALTNTVLTMVSSDAPLAFTVTAAVTAPAAPATWISVNHASGIAYTYGTPITVSFLTDVLYNANVADHLTGTVTVTPTGGAPINIGFTIIVDEPPAAITRIFPTQTPVQNANALTVIVTGTGFGIANGYAAHPTAVSITYGPNPQTTAVLGTLTGGSVAVANQNTLILTIPKDDGATPAVPILSAAGTVTISIQNGNIGSAVTTPLTVTASPIIYTVTDAGSLEEATPGTSPTFAPYELITLFGDNFGPTAGTPVQATVDPFSRYPNSLTANGQTLKVTFTKTSDNSAIADAYLLFASNNQINALVPSGVVGKGQVNIVVTYHNVASSAFVANVAAQNPGVFTVTSSGQGQGAILLSDFSLNSNSNPGLAGKTTVLIYLTGLGVPNSTDLNATAATKAAFPTTCISPANYMTTINALPGNANWASVDGAVIQSAQLASNHLPPCMATANAVTVTIGGQTATVSYAGWVGDSVAGLYQINALVPAKANPSKATPPAVTAVPVVVTVGGANSQTGVTMFVK